MDLIPYAYGLLQSFLLTVQLLAVTGILLLALFRIIDALGAIPLSLTQHTSMTLRRGKQYHVCRIPNRSPFHPNAYVEPQHRNHSAYCWMMWLVDEVLTPAIKVIASAGLAFVIRKLKDVCSMQNLKTRVAPVGTRIQRGIAQVATLQKAFASQTAAFRIPYRYLCPASCVLALFVELVFVVGTPVGVTAVLCFGGLLLIVAGDIGASGPQEDESEGDQDEVDNTAPNANVSTTDVAGSTPTAALQAQV